jgi:hypothetical protein
VSVREEKALSRIFGRNTDEIKGKWRKLSNGEVYSLPDIIRAIKLGRVR